MLVSLLLLVVHSWAKLNKMVVVVVKELDMQVSTISKPLRQALVTQEHSASY